MEVRSFDSLDDARALRAKMAELNRRARRPDPFSTFEFYENFVENDEFHPEGIHPWLLAAFEHDELVGYLALKRSRIRSLGIPSTKVDFLVTHDTDRPHAVAPAEDERRCTDAFLRHLIDRRDEWDFLELQQQDEGSPLHTLPELPRSAYLVRAFPTLENGTIPLRWPSVREYFASFNRKFRSNVSRQMRALFAEGNVEVVRSFDPRATPILFDLLLAIEPSSWKSQAAAAITRNPRRVAYFRGLMHPRQPMRIGITIVLLDRMPIAGLVTGEFEHRRYALHIVFDDRYAHLSPGGAVLFIALCDAIDARASELNLLSGFAYYKTRWLAEISRTHSVQIYRVGRGPWAKAVLGSLRRRALPTRLAATAQKFNPVRRAVTPNDPFAPAPAPIEPARRSAIDALVEEALKTPCAYLDAAALAATMPFETESSARSARRA